MSERVGHEKLRKAAGWLLTPLHQLVFVATLLVFHPLQVLARRLGYGAHKRVVDGLNGCLLVGLRLLGTRIELDAGAALPQGRPLIVVANHQSFYDIPLIGWLMRAHHPKFVAKQELGRGLPSVSYNLRHGGSVLIDRDDPRQALTAIKSLGRHIEEHGHAACIFPEGTRARDGVLKPFNHAGVVSLLNASARAVIVPVAIDGSWELVRYRMWPIPFGVRVRCTVLPAVEREGRRAKEVARLVEEAIGAHLRGGSPADDPSPPVADGTVTAD